MKISREKIFALNALFSKLSQQKTNVMFQYTIAKNKRLLVPEIESVREAQEDPTPNERLSEYQEKRINLCKVYCNKDENGEPIILDIGKPTSRFDFNPEEKEKLNAEMEPINEEYKDAIEEQEKKEKDFYELTQEEVDIPFNLFKLKDMPKEITGIDLDLLFDFIEE